MRIGYVALQGTEEVLVAMGDAMAGAATASGVATEAVLEAVAVEITDTTRSAG